MKKPEKIKSPRKMNAGELLLMIFYGSNLIPKEFPDPDVDLLVQTNKAALLN